MILADGAGGNCARMGLNATYTISADAGIITDNLATLEPFTQTFTTGAACDTSLNAMGGVTHVDGETTASVRFTTSKASTTELRYGLSGGPLDCLGVACPVLGDPTTTANALHTVNITGLTVDLAYDFVASAEDDVGTVATARGTIQTAPLPRIAVNEICANPTVDEAKGEFIEIASFEQSVTTDLTGWTMRTTHESSTGNLILDDCDIPAATSIAPLAFLVFTGPTFDPTAYPGMNESTIVHMSSLCSLVDDSNGGPYLIELFDPAGRPVSSMTVPDALAPDGSDAGNGKSIERIDPAAPDEAASYCISSDAIGPTPGAQNGAQAGCG
jgi:hypothetical protein